MFRFNYKLNIIKEPFLITICKICLNRASRTKTVGCFPKFRFLGPHVASKNNILRSSTLFFKKHLKFINAAIDQFHKHSSYLCLRLTIVPEISSNNKLIVEQKLEYNGNGTPCLASIILQHVPRLKTDIPLETFSPQPLFIINPSNRFIKRQILSASSTAIIRYKYDQFAVSFSYRINNKLPANALCHYKAINQIARNESPKNKTFGTTDKHRQEAKYPAESIPIICNKRNLRI